MMSVTIIDIVKGGMQMAVLRYSKQRESIKNYLCGREDHPTADMIYTSIREEYPNISLGTIYRNLSLLVEIGEIQKITTDGADRFDARVTPHNHFVCRRCGRVMDLKRTSCGMAERSTNAGWNSMESVRIVKKQRIKKNY